MSIFFLKLCRAFFLFSGTVSRYIFFIGEKLSVQAKKSDVIKVIERKKVGQLAWKSFDLWNRKREPLHDTSCACPHERHIESSRAEFRWVKSGLAH